MEVYKRETRKAIRRFLAHRISFAKCISALDAALADAIPRLPREQFDALRALMFANYETVIKEMERRGAARENPK